MKNIFINIAFLSFSNLVCAQFPYYNPLQNDNEISSITNGTNTNIRTNQSVNNDGTINASGTPTKGVLLTNTTNQKNGFVLKDLKFATSEGFNIDFEYFQWGNGSLDYGVGDGLALVLFNATQTNPQMGADGAALGYTSTYRSGTYTPGFTDGYMAFGIDNYGNFANRMTTSNESRNGVTNRPSTTGSTLNNNYNDKKSTFVIRGTAYDNALNSNGTGYNRNYGYPILRAVSTNSDYGTININNVDKPYKVLSLRTNQDGTHGYNVNTYFNNFNVRGGAYTDNYKASGFRKANIHFLKGVRKFYTNETNYNSNTNAIVRQVYLVTVKIETETNTYTILDNTGFSSDGSLNYNYYEDTGNNISSSLTYNSNYVKKTSTKAPTELSMAFTGTTGGAKQNQLLRNVNITLPFSPEVKSFSNNNICPDSPQSNIIYPIKDAIGYENDKYEVSIIGDPDLPQNWVTKNIAQGGQNNSFIDPASFSFMVVNPTTNKYVKNSTPYELNVYNALNQIIGKYHYVYKDNNGNTLSAAQSYIYYQSIIPLPLINEKHVIRYTVKNKTPNGGINNISANQYTSSIGTIENNFGSVLCGKTHIITNKNVSTTL